MGTGSQFALGGSASTGDGGPGGGSQWDAACAATSVAAEAVLVEKEVTVEVPVEIVQPVALYIMQDRSSSMIGTCAPGDPCNPQGWNEAKNAITAFVNSEASADIDIGLGYFPPLANNAQCNGSTCAEPDVRVAPLPGNASQIISSLERAMPTSNPALYTPTECALRGMTQFCKQYMAENGEQCVAVLASDGAPTRCNEDTGDLAEIAADAFANDGVLTFTLGMSGADFDVLDSIAAAGGTDCDPSGARSACDVTSGAEAFLDALNGIRETIVVTETRTETVTEVVTTIVDCEWGIPEPKGGQVFDPEKVNVTFSDGEAAPVSVGRVPSGAECGNFEGGWHFDDASNPRKVIACPDTCEVIQSATEARVDLAFGCETVLAVPR